MADVSSETIEQALKDVFDPELGVNIVDLGLVYGIQVNDGEVRIVMTMTTPGCPAQEHIASGVKQRLLQVPGVQDVQVEMVWSPPWSPELMSDETKFYFGL